MKISYLNNSYKTNFRAITLSKAEIKQAQTVINSCTDALSTERKKTVWTKLYNIFRPHIEAEASLKSGKYCIYSDVLSELKVRFIETINNISLNNDTIQQLVSVINSYKPTKETISSDYLYKSLDKGIRLNKGQFLTTAVAHTPEPTSAATIEKYKLQLENTLENNSLTPKEKRRLEANGEGKSMAAIAREENVCPSVVQDRIKSGKLKIQRKNGQVPAKYKELSKQLAEILNCTEDKALSLIIRMPRLAGSTFTTIEKNLDECSKLLKMTKNEYIKDFGIKNPSFLFYNHQTLNQHIQDSSAVMHCTYNDYIKMGKKDPTILYLKAETIQNYIEKKSKFLERSADDITKAIKRMPAFLYTKVSTMGKYIKKLMNVLKCSREEAIDLIIAQPSAMFYKTQLLRKTIKEGAKTLKCTEEEFAHLCFKQQTLLTLSSDTLKAHVEETSRLLGCTPEEFIEIGKSRPSILCMNPELIKQKNEILNYYKKIKNEAPSTTLLSLDSNEVLYLRILAYLLNKSYNAKINIANSKKLVPEFIKNSSEIFRLNIPVDSAAKEFTEKTNIANSKKLVPESLKNSNELFRLNIPAYSAAKGFTEFTQEYSTRILGKNIFEFNIV